MHKAPEREDEPMNVSQQRDQWWPGRAAGRRRMGRAETTEGGGVSIAQSTRGVHRMHTSTPTLVCTACYVWVTPG